MTQLALILPCHNPSPGWENDIVTLFKHLTENFTLEISVTIIDDGSTPQIGQDAKTYLQQHIASVFFLQHPTNRGKGQAIRTGLSQNESDYYIYTDCDIPFSHESIENVLKQLQSGFDIVTTERVANYWKNLPLQRKLISKGCRLINRFLLQMKNPDSQAGLKGFNKKGKKLMLQTRINRFLFDTEFILMAEKSGRYTICSVSIEFTKDISFSNFSWRNIFIELKNSLYLLRKL